MSTPLTPRALEAANSLFAEQELGEAIRLLEEECGEAGLLLTGDNGAAAERIRLAVLKLSQGALPRLRHQITTAQRDWRDSSVFAGFGDDVHAHLGWIPMPPGKDA